jgi:hypothetical protein
MAAAAASWVVVTYCTDQLLEQHREELSRWLGHFEARTCFKTARTRVLPELPLDEAGAASVLAVLGRYGRMELEREDAPSLVARPGPPRTSP